MFVNRVGDTISRAGIAWILGKYSEIAHELLPEHAPTKVHPHMLRHSKAMHMLEDGVNVVYIRDFLGHSSIVTTEIYAKASVKAKQAAIENASRQILKNSDYGCYKRFELMDWLRSIM